MSPVETTTKKNRSQPGLRRNFVWRVLQTFMQASFAIWFRFSAEGAKHLDDNRGGLIIANHQSFLDPALIGIHLQRPVSFLARHGLFRVPFIGWIMRHCYVIPLNQEAPTATSLKLAIERMREGYLVGIFPEGARCEDGQVAEFLPGFLALIRRSKVPVYPVGIAGAYQAMKRGTIIPRPRTICLVYGEPFDEALVAELSGKKGAEQLMQMAQQRVVELCNQAEQRRLGRPVMTPTQN